MTNQGSDKLAQPATALPLIRLGWVFLKIGTKAFGGLGAALALIERELVDRRGVLTKEQVTEALTYTKLLPGSTVVQVVSYLGFKLGGWPGSALATIAFVLPSAAAMTLLAVLYVSVSDLPGIAPTIKGLAAAVVGILLATTIRLGQANIKNLLTLALAGAAFVSAVVFGINAAVIVVVAGLVGLLALSSPTSPDKPKGDGA